MTAGDSPPARDLRELADRLAILDALYGYLDRVDANDCEAAAAHFADDGWADYMTGRRIQGPDAIARALRSLLAQFEVTSHHVTNARVEVTGEQATVRTCIYAYHRLSETGQPWHFWGRYAQRWVRSEGAWRIGELTLIGVDAEPPWHFAPPELFAGRLSRLSPE